MKYHLFAVALLSHACVSAGAKEAKPDDFGILDWIHTSEGGFFNPKQDFRYTTPGDATSVPGIFAKERIEKGEVLCKVPYHRWLKSDDPTEEGQLCCGTAESVAREMKAGADSKDFAPYAVYLNSQQDGQIPSDWSDLGKQLLQQITGGPVTDPMIPPTEPTEWLEFDWYQRCHGDPADKISSKAALLVVQRSDDYYMVPGYDMYNHR